MIDAPQHQPDAIDAWILEASAAERDAVMARVYESEIEFLRDRLGVDVDNVDALQKALDDGSMMARLDGHNSTMMLTFGLEAGLWTLEGLNTEMRKNGITEGLKSAEERAEQRRFEIACAVVGTTDRKAVENALRDEATWKRVQTLTVRPDGILQRMRARLGEAGKSLQ